MKKTIVYVFMMAILITTAMAEWVYQGSGIWYDADTDTYCNESVESCPPIYDKPVLVSLEEFYEYVPYFEGNDTIYNLSYITRKYWMYDTAAFFFKVPDTTTCIWSNKETRDCYVDVEFEYKLNNNISFSLVQPNLKFRNKDNQRPFNFEILDLDSNVISKGNYTLRYSFEFPPNEQDKINISFFGIEIDPQLSSCAVINESGYYELTAPIIESGTTNCIHINATDVFFTCNGNLIDGDTNADYGIFGDFVTEDDRANVTVVDCIVSDWDTNQIRFTEMGDILIRNTSVINTTDTGIYLYNSDYSYLDNITLNGGSYGFRIISSQNTSLTNLFINATSNTGLYGLHLSYLSLDITLENITISDMIMPIYWSSSVTGDLITENIRARCDKDMDYQRIEVIKDYYDTEYGNETNITELIVMGSGNITITNVTMNNSPQNPCGGIFFVSDVNFTLFNNTFIYISGLYADFCTGYHIRHNYFENYSSRLIMTTGSHIQYKNYTINDNIFKNKGSREETIYISQYMDYAQVYNNYFEFDNSSAIEIYFSNVENFMIYNNLFNMTQDTVFGKYISANVGAKSYYYNTSLQEGERIYGDGPFIGGNVYLNESNTGYYHTCESNNNDGICNEPFGHDYGYYDYLPLSDEYNATLFKPSLYIFSPTQDESYYGTASSVYVNVTYKFVDADNSTLELTMEHNLTGVYVLNATNITSNNTNISNIITFTEVETDVCVRINISDGNFTNSKVVCFYVETSPDRYVQILQPTTEVPINVSSGDNITINFTYTQFSVNITENVSLIEVLIGGLNTTILNATIEEDVYDTVEWESFLTAGEPGDNWSTSGDCVWTRDNDGTASSTTGPCGGVSNCPGDDAGYDDNWYVYIETSNNYCDESTFHGYLTYEDLDFSLYDNVTVYFAYCMYGSDVGLLTLEINDSGGWDVLWAEVGNHDTPWFLDNVTISGYEGLHDIRFNYDRWGGSGFRGDVALDVLNITTMVSGAESPYQFGYIDDIGWQVNVTVPDFETGLKDLFVNTIYNSSLANSTETKSVNYGGVSTCECSSIQGGTTIDCTEDCTIDDDCDASGQDLIFDGDGLVRIYGNITNHGTVRRQNGCQIACIGGCF